jgi:rod shape-determining protein MreC
VQYSAPPLFKQGISALAKLIACLVISLALMIIDFQIKSLDFIRNQVNIVVRPFEQLMLLPGSMISGGSDYLTSRSTLEKENEALKLRQAELSLLANQSALLAVENQNLRSLLDLQKKVTFKTVPVEISQRVVINRGENQGLRLGSPIANDMGILGQVVRLFDHSAEVSLLEDRDFAVPVLVARNGLRAAVVGSGRGQLLQLRYLPVASDLEVGDILLTSGVDGVYPPGFAVAVITKIERNLDQNSANVFCSPIAEVNRHLQALALIYDPQLDAKPASNSNAPSSTGRRQTRPKGQP